MARRALVTGADGFIGSHLTELLVSEGYAVRALAMYNAFGSRGWLDHLPEEIQAEVDIVLGNVRDASSVHEWIADRDVVFHLAALIGIPYSYRAPQSYVDTNVGGTLNVLVASRRSSVEKIVHTSTSEVYGSAVTVPIDERHPLQGQSPYAASKIAADQLAFSFFASFGFPVVTVRPVNTYGPRQSTRAVIPTVITQLVDGSGVIELGSLHPMRDFTFVSDTALGFLAADRSPDASGEVVNLGTGHEISIGDLAHTLGGLMGIEPEIVQQETRVRPEKSEVSRLVADTAKARDILGWEPGYDYVVLLQPTSPLRTSVDIDACIERCVDGGHPPACR